MFRFEDTHWIPFCENRLFTCLSADNPPIQGKTRDEVMDMDTELPIGFLMALAENPNAMVQFSSMDRQEQTRITERARQARSREDMHAIVSEMGGQAHSFQSLRTGPSGSLPQNEKTKCRTAPSFCFGRRCSFYAASFSVIDQA